MLLSRQALWALAFSADNIREFFKLPQDHQTRIRIGSNSSPG